MDETFYAPQVMAKIPDPDFINVHPNILATADMKLFSIFSRKRFERACIDTGAA